MAKTSVSLASGSIKTVGGPGINARTAISIWLSLNVCLDISKSKVSSDVK